MEKIPIIEKRENEEQKLIKLLREKGFDDPESRELLLEWTIGQEKLVEQSNDYPLEQIRLNIRRARLYYSAGNSQVASEAFEDALTQAWNEEREELYRQILQEMDDKGL